MSVFDYDTIIRYVEGEMQPVEQQAFEEELLIDQVLKNEVELYREVYDRLKMNFYPDSGEQALRESLLQIQPEFFAPRSKIVSFGGYRRWLTAAAAMILLFIGIWNLWKVDLYRQYIPTQMAVAERGADSDSVLQVISEKFNARKFKEAIPVFETYLNQHPGNSFAQYYYSISLLETNNLAKSREQLLLLYNGISLFRHDAAFLMALSYLKQKNIPACKEWLHKIPVDASPFNRAQDLLKKLGDIPR